MSTCSLLASDCPWNLLFLPSPLVYMVELSLSSQWYSCLQILFPLAFPFDGEILWCFSSLASLIHFPPFFGACLCWFLVQHFRRQFSVARKEMGLYSSSHTQCAFYPSQMFFSILLHETLPAPACYLCGVSLPHSGRPWLLCSAWSSLPSNPLWSVGVCSWDQTNGGTRGLCWLCFLCSWGFLSSNLLLTSTGYGNPPSDFSNVEDWICVSFLPSLPIVVVFFNLFKMITLLLKWVWLWEKQHLKIESEG